MVTHENSDIGKSAHFHSFDPLAVSILPEKSTIFPMSLAGEEFRQESGVEAGAADEMDAGEGPDILEGNKSGQLGEFLVREARIIEQNI